MFIEKPHLESPMLNSKGEEGFVFSAATSLHEGQRNAAATTLQDRNQKLKNNADIVDRDLRSWQQRKRRRMRKKFWLLFMFLL